MPVQLEYIRTVPVISPFDSPLKGLEFLRWAQPNLRDPKSTPDAVSVLQARDEVLDRFGPLFRDRVASITEEDISDFLDVGKNHHWTGLHRQKSLLLSEMRAVRKAISRLTKRGEVFDDVAKRFDEANQDVKGFTEAIITPILYVAHPEHYGVWNAKSEFALRILNLWVEPSKGDSKGYTYEKVNGAILQARLFLNRGMAEGEDKIDLWTIEYYWHSLKVMHDDGRFQGLVKEFE